MKHPFDISGNGPAPYAFGGVTDVANHCDHCGTKIRYNFHFTSAQGNAFVVGSDCVLKATDTAEYLIAKKWKRDHAKALAKARKEAKVKDSQAACFAEFTDLESLFAVDHRITRDIKTRFDRYGSVSPRQVDLLRKLKGEGEAKVSKAAEVQKISIKVPEIVNLFKNATGNLQAPGLHFSVSGRPLKVQMAGSGSRRPGDFYVTDGGKYGSSTFYGWIDAETGAFEARSAAPSWVSEFLVKFNADPVAVATDHQHATGKCCFCNIPLEAAESLNYGYGRTCAKNWGLPYSTSKKVHG